jgi:uncharacterized damage-inducible protein DinB
VSDHGIHTFVEGWARYQSLVVDAIRDLTPDQIGLRAAPHQWAVWQLASHMAGSRAYWFHDILGEGEPAVRDMFRVESTTVPDLPIEDAGWEDDEDRPRTSADIIEALDRTWAMIRASLDRWTSEELDTEFSRVRRSGTETFTRRWVVWHLIEHDLHHGGEISQTLGTHGLPPLDL